MIGGRLIILSKIRDFEHENKGFNRTTPSNSGTTTTTSSTERGATTPTTSTPKTPVLPQIVAPVITIPKSISSLPETSNLTKFGSSHGGSNSDGNGDSETITLISNSVCS